MPAERPFGIHVDHAALVARVSELCPLPKTAVRVMQLTRDASASWKAIVGAVETDPSLATEILRVASSPAYQTRYARADDLNAACRVLGQRELHDLTAAMAMLSTFRTEHAIGVHDTAVGALAAQLASRTAAAMRMRGKSRAFLAGLLSEIGALACLSVDPEAYIALREANSTEGARVAAEERRYRATSFAIGSSLLAQNGLGSEICRAVHATDHNPLSSLVRFSRQAAATVLEAAGPREAWLEEVERILGREGLVMEPPEIARVTLESVAASAPRLRGAA